jgi:hypothetical protein
VLRLIIVTNFTHITAVLINSFIEVYPESSEEEAIENYSAGFFMGDLLLEEHGIEVVAEFKEEGADFAVRGHVTVPV